MLCKKQSQKNCEYGPHFTADTFLTLHNMLSINKPYQNERNIWGRDEKCGQIKPWVMLTNFPTF